jgi:hypothetical protein
MQKSMIKKEQQLWIGKKANRLELYGTINFINIPNMHLKWATGMNTLCLK